MSPPRDTVNGYQVNAILLLLYIYIYYLSTFNLPSSYWSLGFIFLLHDSFFICV